jgi:hypothetical protein
MKQDFIFQKIEPFITTSVRTWNPTYSHTLIAIAFPAVETSSRALLFCKTICSFILVLSCLFTDELSIWRIWPRTGGWLMNDELEFGGKRPCPLSRYYPEIRFEGPRKWRQPGYYVFRQKVEKKASWLQIGSLNQLAQSKIALTGWFVLYRFIFSSFMCWVTSM